jgi:hypothetical protein
MKLEFRNILHVLACNKVEFIVVGGVAAVLPGASFATFDLDIVHRRTPDSIARLDSTLKELNAICRLGPARKLRPSTDALAGAGRRILDTWFGPLAKLKRQAGQPKDPYARPLLEALLDEKSRGSQLAGFPALTFASAPQQAARKCKTPREECR